MRIEFIGSKTKIITKADQDIVSLILKSLKENKLSLIDKDVLIIASKIVSTIEGCQIKISDIVNIRKEAFIAAKISNLSPEFVEIVFREADEVIGAVPGAVLALKDGVLQANAGVDHSNSGGEEFLITLPKNSIKTAEKIRKEIEYRLKIKIGVIIADSKTHPLRRGTSGFALGVSGFSPIIDDRGSNDLFNRPMKITTRAIADNLVCGSEILMGESNQRIPIVIARGYEEISLITERDGYEYKLSLDLDEKESYFKIPKIATGKAGFGFGANVGMKQMYYAKSKHPTDSLHLWKQVQKRPTWNTWLENNDEATDSININSPSRYSLVLDIAPFAYDVIENARVASVGADPNLAKFLKTIEQSLQFLLLDRCRNLR